MLAKWPNGKELDDVICGGVVQLAKSALHSTLNLCTFLASALRHE